LPQMPKWKFTLRQSLKFLLEQSWTLGLSCLCWIEAAKVAEEAKRARMMVLENMLLSGDESIEDLKWEDVIIECLKVMIVDDERYLFSAELVQFL